MLQLAMPNTYVLYHAGCSDGFGAAWAAWRKLGDSASYLPVRHADPAPQLEGAERVFVVDFAYGRAVLDRWVAQGIQVQVLDHHKTAQAELAGFAGAFFDMSKSGAVLSWEHFHPGTEIPKLLAHIQDRDLWQHRIEGTQEIMAALAAQPMDFERWSAVSQDLVGLRRDGEVLLRSQMLDVERMCKHAFWRDVGGYRVPVVNASCLWSDVGNALLELFPDAPFAGVYNDIGSGLRKWSLRSTASFDVSVVAQSLGGGGHAQAAGFVELRAPAAEPTPEG